MIEVGSSEIEQRPPYHKDVDDEDVLKFMDSLDSYLSLVDSLSSTLRQGFFDFASARYSMGTSRVNSVLLDLKEHSAATHLEVAKGDEPHFTLCKWTSDDAADPMEMKEAEEDSSPSGSSSSVDDQVQKERSKSLAVFGALVSPKLGAAQLSFETALEKLVEIANARASMLYAFERVREHIDGIED